MDHKQVYKSYQEKISALRYAIWLIHWDFATEKPKGGFEFAIEQLATLNAEIYKIRNCEERIEAIEALYLSDIDDVFKRELYLEKKSIDQMKKIPQDEYLAYQKLISGADNVWAEAKEKKDFSMFKPTLDEIVSYNRKMIKYLESDELKGYDVLLDMYEEGMTVKDYDHFFNTLSEKLVPFVLEKAKIKQHHPKILTKGTFDVELQKKYNHSLPEYMNYDMNHGVIKESIHPFTSGYVSSDVRITTAYRPHLMESAIFSTIHEMGHAIYEQQINPDYQGTALGAGASMGIHESQSRLYENMLGRSRAFWEVNYPNLQKTFKKELKHVSLDEFYAYINRVECGFIRTEADELTYSLHVMVRYEIEKELFNGTLETKDLPKKWNELYKKYLGVKVKNDQEGILQDIHWAGGSFGYFPTYALGSAYAAQIYHAMKRDIPIEHALRNSQMKDINAWLKEKIHTFGSLKTPKELMIHATKEPFNPNYFINYLIEKYSKLIQTQ